MMLNAAKLVARRANMIGLIYLVGAIYSLSQQGLNWIMVAQLILAIVLLGCFNYSLNYLQTHQKFNHLRTLKITDFPSLLYCVYIILFYILYAGYQLFTAFHWPELLLIIGNIFLLMALYNNAVSYNVIVGNLTYFYNQNEIEISNDEWNKFKFKNQIID